MAKELAVLVFSLLLSYPQDVKIQARRFDFSACVEQLVDRHLSLINFSPAQTLWRKNQLRKFFTALSNCLHVICPTSLPSSTTGRRRLFFRSISCATSVISSSG
jgi:hypothetical protein